jgi:ribosome biogenesis GTPase
VLSEGFDATVGDWLLFDSASGRLLQRLQRKSLFQRRAPGTERRIQLIAANIDTLFVVSSCNQDFNEARIERYLAIAREAGVMAIVVLTKSDLTEDPRSFVHAAAKLAPDLLVEAVNALDKESLRCLDGWLGKGQTIALLGSSGVGKSTITNTLLGQDRIETKDIRHGDDKGRHTTTSRSLFQLPGNAWLLDTPGMRELQLTCLILRECVNCNSPMCSRASTMSSPRSRRCRKTANLRIAPMNPNRAALYSKP